MLADFLVATCALLVIVDLAAESPIAFHLCRQNVDAVTLTHDHGKGSVYIMLTDRAARELAMLSRNNIGSAFSIVIDDNVLVEAIASDGVESGMLKIGAHGKKKTASIIDMLTVQLTVEPCGSITTM